MSNPDIDKTRSELNYHLIDPQHKYYYEIQSRVEAAQCKVRKDSVKFIDTIITASPEFFASRPPEDAHKYFEHALKFLEDEIGKENIFSAVVHMDEHNPHMHLCFVPLTKDNRLSAKDIIGNRSKLVEWQDKFHEHMSAMFPELQRGEPAAETKRKHIPTWLFKQANRLTEQMAAMKNEIDSIGTFNAQKKKEKLQEMFCKWYPQVNSFEAKLEPLKMNMDILNHNNRVIQNELDRESIRRQQSESSLYSLQLQLEEYQEFIDSIPDNLKKQLLERHEQNQEQEMNL